MKLFLKESVYFEIQVPDGSDRAQITTEFRTNISPMFRQIVKSIVVDPEDVQFLETKFGKPCSIKVLTEREALNQLNQPGQFK